MTDEIKRIIWAIDPFESDLVVDPATIKEIGQWADEKKIEIEPVYVFSPISKLETLVTEKIEDQISSTLSSWNLHTRSPKAILNPAHTTASAVNCLLSHAESSGAGLIMVSSHGRRGLQRMLFGSFAETLLATSQLPILFLNQHKRLTGASIKKALWATDFSQACEKAFDSFIHSSHGISNELLLFHDVSLPLEMNAYFLGWDVGVPPIDDVLEMQRFRARERANEWIKNARELGIRVEKTINDGYGNIKDEVLSAAKENKVGLIVMSSQASPFISFLLGSQAREVFRASECPVWIYGPKFSEGRAARKEKGKMHISEETTEGTDRNRPEVSIQDLMKRIHGVSEDDVHNILVAVLHSIRDRLPDDQAAIFERKMPDLFKNAFRVSWQPKHTKTGNFIADVGDRLEVSQKLNLADSIREVMETIKTRFRAEEIKNLSVLQEIILELGQAGI